MPQTSKNNRIVTRLFLVNDKEELYLLLRNGKGGNKNNSTGKAIKRWITPGGVVDLGEKPLDCVLRETEEETGLKLDKKKVVQLLEQYDPVFDVMMVFYYCLEWDGLPVVTEPEKFDRVVWTKPDKISKLPKKDEHIGALIETAAMALTKELKKTKHKPVYATW